MPSVTCKVIALLSAAVFCQQELTAQGAMGSTLIPANPASAAPPPTNGASVQFPPLSEAEYETDTEFDQGGSRALFSMVHVFIDVIQSNPLPRDLIQDFIAADDFSLVLRNNYHKLAMYEIGFLVCLALGLLFFLLSPFVALFFCCCRCCCGKCGGRMHQSDAKARSSCRRISYSVLLLVSCLFAIGGLVCLLQANVYTHYDSGTSFAGSKVRKLVKNNLHDFNAFAENTVKQLDEVIAQNVPVRAIATDKVNGVGRILGGTIQKNLSDKITGPQRSVLDTVHVISRTKGDFNTVNESMTEANLWAVTVNATLDDIRNNLTIHLSPCSAINNECERLLNESTNISLASNFIQFSLLVNGITAALQLISSDELKHKLDKGNETFSNITGIVDAAAQNIKGEVCATLESVGNELQNFSSRFGLSDYLRDIHVATSQIQERLNDVQEEAMHIDKLRFWGVLGVVLILSLIVLCFIVGLCLGTFGHSKWKSPPRRGCCSNCGGVFLMAGVGFVFIVSWILMLIVALLFFTGGNLHALVCKPLTDKSLLHFVDGVKLQDQAANQTFLGHILGVDSNITLTQIYWDCKRNHAFYSTLKMEEFQSLDDLIDISQEMQKIKDDFNGINVDLSSVEILDAAGQQIMRDFAGSGVEMDYGLLLDEVDKGLINTDIIAYANDLKAYAAHVASPNGEVLRGIAQELHDIASDMPSDKLTLMKTSILSLIENTKNISSKVEAVLADVQGAQSAVINSAPSVTSHETSKYIDFLILDFDLYISWIKSMIESEVGRCLPVANLVDSLHIIGCSCVLDSLNGMWFGLGWTLVFLIISLIFAVKLAKYFRRMKAEDSFESDMIYTSQVNKSFNPYPSDFSLPRIGS